MRRSMSRRAGVLLGLGLLIAVHPVAAQGVVPEAGPAATVRADVVGVPGIASDLLAGATTALDGLGSAFDSAVDRVVDAVTPASGPCSGTGGLDMGKDGRLTIALLGSDYRSKHYIGERMDVIIVATLKTNGHVAMASIPRDTVYFPKAGGGTSGRSRVNTIYYTYKRHKNNTSGVDCSALKRFTSDIAAALATEIDYFAMVRMHTFVNLVDNIDFVLTDVPGAIVDTSYGRRGVYFPKERDYRLVGNAACRKKPFKCRSALAYVRSRHGTQGSGSNNDFKRAERQHTFIFDTAKRVLARGNGSNLTALAAAVSGAVVSNAPKNLTVARALFDKLSGISMAGQDTVVLGPSTFARTLSNPSYSYRLKLSAVRGWINRHFGS